MGFSATLHTVKFFDWGRESRVYVRLMYAARKKPLQTLDLQELYMLLP
jgi:hypothetical protein